jgi:hypothetical protein
MRVKDAFVYYVSYYRVAHEWLKQHHRPVNVTDMRYFGSAEVFTDMPATSWDTVQVMELAIQEYEVDKSEEALEWGNFFVKILYFTVLRQGDVTLEVAAEDHPPTQFYYVHRSDEGAPPTQFYYVNRIAAV